MLNLTEGFRFLGWVIPEKWCFYVFLRVCMFCFGVFFGFGGLLGFGVLLFLLILLFFGVFGGFLVFCLVWFPWFVLCCYLVWTGLTGDFVWLVDVLWF